MDEFELIALTAPAMADPSIAIAASRAGALGVLNLEFVTALHEARGAVAKMARHARRETGIKLDSTAADGMNSLLSDLPDTVRIIIFTAANAELVKIWVPFLHDQKRRVWLEVSDGEQARLGEQAGVDGLVAKGHEAGGWVGEETTFILLQRLLSQHRLPVFAQGGIGLHTAAACAAAGAAGVVLDYQLGLARESPLHDPVRTAIAAMDGSETILLGREVGHLFRAYSRPRLRAINEVTEIARGLIRNAHANSIAAMEWRRAVEGRIGWDRGEEGLYPLGQDATFAAPLAERYGTVGGILHAVRQAVMSHLEAVRICRPLDGEAPLARSHGTRYPIVQGPMTRVSDRAEFALSVAEGGGLPFLALALMRAAEVETLLAQTRQLLAGRPWGVGILGFVPLDLRQEQLEVIRRYQPPFALIAGGRPDQARYLEKDGIATYLHVPSAGLLRLFLKDGARRFVFEGRECGGHVGPRSSFVLWNAMVDVLLEHIPETGAEDFHVLFAGGVHDALSASMVATLAAPLALRGVRIGVLLGTAYLFTQEAVASGAILPGFQDKALRCQRTVLVESGVGHAIRCVENPYTEEFERVKQFLIQEGRSADEIRQALEELNIGRLRVASKGIQRHPAYGQDPKAPPFITVGEEEQHAQGMFMIGQLAGLRHQVVTVANLHHQVTVESCDRLAALPAPVVGTQSSLPVRPSQVAIVGMSCILPKAPDLRAYWEGIQNKFYALTEIPEDRWDWRLYFDADPRAKDKIYSRWGGFISDVPFDPLEYGMPPNSLPSIEPMHLLALKTARAALDDAGYLHRPFDRRRASVILGASGGSGDLGALYNLRSGLPLLFGDAAPQVVSQADSLLPEWTEDSFAGILLNVAAGRIANRFDLGGMNVILDAACASSLAAVHVAVKELETHATDMVIAGGVDTVQSPFGYLCFSKTHALSATGQPRTFDADADGIAISEGVVMLVLKRLADAERDGDRIYAVIQGVGASSDGKAKGLTAPRPEGQMLALERAYAKAGVSPTTVGLFEAHGTGTVVGDRTEAIALSTYLEKAGAAASAHAIGSVKSMIGHTKATAGVAGLAKVALSLHHKVLPPTLGVTTPNPKVRFGDGPLYVNSQTRPWVHGEPDQPRRAGVSAFGFGGTNFHVVVEEYRDGYLPQRAVSPRWPSELFLWAAPSRKELLSAVEALERTLQQGAQPELHDLAFTLCDSLPSPLVRFCARLAIVALTLEDLKLKLEMARAALCAGGAVKDPRGIYFDETNSASKEAVAFLFPGQGSQYPNMLGELAMHFSEVRETFERTDRALADRLPRPLSSYIFPAPAFTPDEERDQQARLTDTQIAQPALGAASASMLKLLQNLDLHAEMTAGHSYGEYTALYAAEVFEYETLVGISEARGRCIVEAARNELGTMAAISASHERVKAILGNLENVWIANLNSPGQTIISGSRNAVEHAMEHARSHGITARSIPVSCAFHSPFVAPAQKRLAEVLAVTRFGAPKLTVFSNSTATPYPKEPAAVAALLADHLIRPVRFTEEIEGMYGAGARIFVEVGPRGVLTALTSQILGERPHLAVATDQPGRPGLTQLQHTLGHLAAHGVAIRPSRLFRDRPVKRLNLATLVEDTKEKSLPTTTWLVNGAHARPAHCPAQPAPRPPFSSLSLQPSRDNGKAAHAPINGKPPEPPGSPSAGNGKIKHLPSFRDSLAGPSKHNGSTVGKSHSVAQPMDTRGGLPGQSLLAVNQPSDDFAQVMLQYQQFVNLAIETQRSVMLAYLRGGSETGHALTPNLSPGVPGEVRTIATSAQPLTPSRVPINPTPPADPSPAVVNRAVCSDLDASGVNPKPPASGPLFAATPEARILPSRQEITQRLLQIVSDRTGYPTDMLELNVDIEAHLGIDSIKRVEILGALQQLYLRAENQLGQDVMEQLTSIKTLEGIITWLESAIVNDAGDEASVSMHAQDKVAMPKSQTASAVSDMVGFPDLGDEIRRLQFVAVEVPALEAQGLRIAPGHVLVLTDDEDGLAEQVAREIRMRGAPCALLRQGTRVGEVGTGIYSANLTNPSQVSEVLTLVRSRLGPVGGIIHMLPLRYGPCEGDNPQSSLEWLDLTAWRERLACDVKSLFHLARAAAEDLKKAAGAGGACVLAAVSMGGTWAIAKADSSKSTGKSGPFFPGDGALAGFLKALALEWPAVRCKAVDLNLTDSPSLLASHLLEELGAADGRIQVGYEGRSRLVFEPRSAPLNRLQPVRVNLGSGQVVFVTGGARGITGEVAFEIARQYRPTLVIAGRSPAPEPTESSETAKLNSEGEIKAALIGQLRRSGEPVDLRQVEALYKRLMRERELRTNLARIASTGAVVRYEQVDVCDENTMIQLVERIERELGPIVGVVHGAGVIEDKLIEDKSPESFNRVFDTKADSAFILSRVLKSDRLQFLTFFSSAAGVFGNRGQSDYAAANELLNKMAVYLDERWPGRVAALGWGPWAKTGMVTAELQRQFAAQGIELISVPAGCRAFEQELLYGHKGESAVVLACGAWGPQPTAALDLRPVAQQGAGLGYPLLGLATYSRRSPGVIEIERTLDPTFDLYLDHHRLDGNPVVPMAVAVELMAEAVQREWPDMHLLGLRDLSVLKGIVLAGGPKTIRLTLRTPTSPSSEGTGVDVRVEITDPDSPNQLYYRGTVELGDRPAEPPQVQIPAGAELVAFPLSVEAAYRKWLFHGPLFQGIAKIEGISDQGMTACLKPSLPQKCMQGSPAGSWMVDPVIFDCGLQLVLLWSRFHYDMTPLPSRFRRYRRFGTMAEHAVHCHIQASASLGGRVIQVKLFFADTNQRLLGLLECLEANGSQDLNRLAGAALVDKETPKSFVHN